MSNTSPHPIFRVLYLLDYQEFSKSPKVERAVDNLKVMNKFSQQYSLIRGKSYRLAQSLFINPKSQTCVNNNLFPQKSNTLFVHVYPKHC